MADLMVHVQRTYERALLEHLIAEHDGTPAAELRTMTHAERVTEHEAEHDLADTLRRGA